MHKSTPFHRESYSRLILDVIIRFYQRCYDQFVELVAVTGDGSKDTETHIAISARWAQKGEVTACLAALSAAAPVRSACRALAFELQLNRMPFFFTEGRLVEEAIMPTRDSGGAQLPHTGDDRPG